MNTKGTAYGNYTFVKKLNKFQVTGRTPLNQTRVALGCFETEQEAKDTLNNFNYNFFEKHSNLLPRCIAINRRDKKFLFTIPKNNKITQFMFQSKNLEEVVDFKNQFILKLI